MYETHHICVDLFIKVTFVQEYYNNVYHIVTVTVNGFNKADANTQ